MSDMLPCPWCADTVLEVRESVVTQIQWVTCTTCGASGPERETAPAAIAAWNRRASGWQSISTAPRDGTRFWGNVGDDAIAMCWHEGFAAFVSSWRRMELALGYTCADTGLSYHDHSPEKHNPTHWQPLPPAPEPTP